MNSKLDTGRVLLGIAFGLAWSLAGLVGWVMLMMNTVGVRPVEGSDSSRVLLGSTFLAIWLAVGWIWIARRLNTQSRRPNA